MVRILSLSLLITIALVSCAGESPSILWQAFQTTLWTPFGLGYALYYTTPLIFTGLSACICFHCGLFNIGAEGQLYLGSIAVVAISSLFPNTLSPLSIVLAIGTCAVAGGIWGMIAGLLKTTRNAHEVLVTILLNFIAIAIVDFLILNLLKNPHEQSPETLYISTPYTLSSLAELPGFQIFQSTPVNSSLFIAIALAFLIHLFLFQTVWGFEMRAVGKSRSASRYAGISIHKNTLLAFLLSGAAAGLVGTNEVMGHQHRVIEGFSPGYGFTGIAVTLLARNHPLFILPSAFLFGCLHSGARDLEFLSERITKEVSIVIQSTIIGIIALEPFIQSLWQKLFRKHPHV